MTSNQPSEDTERDVAKIKEQLSNRHGWVALATKANGFSKSLRRWMPMTTWTNSVHGRTPRKEFAIPFAAEVAEFQEHGPLRAGDQVVVTGMGEVTDELYGIIVDLKVGRRTYAFPLCDLETTDKKSANYQLVKDYAVWFANR